MNLNVIRSENQTEDLLLSTTKNCETLSKETHRKAEETLELKMTQPKETFHFNSPIQIKRDWTLRLTGLENYNSIININTTNNKFKLYTDILMNFHLKS